MTDEPIPTLYEWAGSGEAFVRLMAEFYARVQRDPLLSPVFAGMDARHASFVAAFVAEVFGGPKTYSQEHGGHAHMIARHLGRSLTEAQRRHWVDLLLDSADAVGLPSDPEFRSALVAYLEWGSRLAVLNSQPGVTPEVEAPMPAWGWGVPKKPYRG